MLHVLHVLHVLWLLRLQRDVLLLRRRVPLLLQLLHLPGRQGYDLLLWPRVHPCTRLLVIALLRWRTLHIHALRSMCREHGTALAAGLKDCWQACAWNFLHGVLACLVLACWWLVMRTSSHCMCGHSRRLGCKRVISSACAAA